jgi:hypothetical protein
MDAITIVALGVGDGRASALRLAGFGAGFPAFEARDGTSAVGLGDAFTGFAAVFTTGFVGAVDAFGFGATLRPAFLAERAGFGFGDAFTGFDFAAADAFAFGATGLDGFFDGRRRVGMTISGFDFPWRG